MWSFRLESEPLLMGRLVESDSSQISYDVQSFRVADCHTGHCLVVADVRERLSASKEMHRFLVWRNFISKS